MNLRPDSPLSRKHRLPIDDVGATGRPGGDRRVGSPQVDARLDAEASPHVQVVRTDDDPLRFREPEMTGPGLTSSAALTHAPSPTTRARYPGLETGWSSPVVGCIGVPSGRSEVAYDNPAADGVDADLGAGKLEYSRVLVNVGALNRDLPATMRAPAALEETHRRLDRELQGEFRAVRFEPPFEGRDAAHADAKHALRELGRERSLTGYDPLHDDRLVSLNGRVHAWTLETDGRGGVTVFRHGAGASRLPAASRLSNEDAVGPLRDMGVTVHELSDWKPGELAKVLAAFRMLDPSERGAIDGVTLDRVRTLDNDAAARFSWSSGMSASNRAYRTDVLTMTDAAFAADGNRFVGDGVQTRLPASVGAVLHEVGHAIESHALREASHARNKAAALFLRRHGAAQRHAEQNWFRLAGNPRDQQRFAQSYQDVQRQTARLADAKSALDVRFARRTLNSARRRRDQAVARLGGAATDIARAQDRSVAAARRLATKSVALEETRRPGGDSVRSHDFARAFGRGRVPNVTDYAATAGLKELDAEAFALFRADPAYLKANAPALHEWYASRRHLGQD